MMRSRRPPYGARGVYGGQAQEERIHPQRTSPPDVTEHRVSTFIVVLDSKILFISDQLMSTAECTCHVNHRPRSYRNEARILAPSSFHLNGLSSEHHVLADFASIVSDDPDTCYVRAATL